MVTLFEEDDLKEDLALTARFTAYVDYGKTMPVVKHGSVMS